jgi:hypothetical protein
MKKKKQTWRKQEEIRKIDFYILSHTYNENGMPNFYLFIYLYEKLNVKKNKSRMAIKNNQTYK